MISIWEKKLSLVVPLDKAQFPAFFFFCEMKKKKKNKLCFIAVSIM